MPRQALVAVTLLTVKYDSVKYDEKEDDGNDKTQRRGKNINHVRDVFREITKVH